MSGSVSSVHDSVRAVFALACVVLLVSASTPASSGGVLGNEVCGVLPVDPLGGCLQWQARHDGSSLGDDGPVDVAVSPDGSKVFVAGFSFTRPPEDTGYDYTILSYDAQTGDELWYELYRGADETGAPNDGDDFAMAITVSPDGDTVYVTGMSHGYDPEHGVSATGVATIAYDAQDGDLLWEARETGPGLGTDIGRDVVASDDGTQVFVSATIQGADNQNVAVYAYDAATGAPSWEREYNGPADRHDNTFFRSLGLSPDGETVYVSMQSYSGVELGYDYAVIAYSAADGSIVWEARWDGGEGNVDRAFGLDVAPDGSNVYVTGRSRLAGSDYDYGTVAFDAQTGAHAWDARYDGEGLRDDAFSVKANPDGSLVFVTGQSDGGDLTGYDYATVAYDSQTGEEVWATRHDGTASGNDAANTLAVDPESLQVYVTGRSAGPSGATDMVTLAYQADTGVAVWTNTYNGPAQGNDAGIALTPSPDGSTLFVTGDSYTSPTTSYDILTVAIDTGGAGLLPELPDLPV